MATNPSPSKLEEALSTAKENDEQSIRKVLRAFVLSRVFVKLDLPWDGKTLPRSDMRLLFVSDGTNAQQPMLAVFSTEAHSRVYGDEAKPFTFVTEVDSAWACLGVPENAGIMINPNSVPNFRIGPEVAQVLRETAKKDVTANMELPSAESPPTK
ncbi:MAG TPA: SseB family protein [Candidatus Saccharimonadales bacterium]|nr:SseB family protein [Candidatus Saccharimonadales bacterium]